MYDGTENSVSDSVSITAVFQYPPVELDNVVFIQPMGRMSGNHVTPTDHQYYVAEDGVETKVYSPEAGTITNIQLMAAEKIMEAAPTEEGGYTNPSISVVAGEEIGSYTGSVDYNVVDDDVDLTGFVKPESYIAESWKTHTPDPFDYFSESIQADLIAKCLRTVAPLGGKIDYDIDGTMVGNWFLEETNGYEGAGGIESEDYWVGHLALAYNHIDPDHITVSMGDFNDEPKQFGVVGNTPDPAEVSVETGLVKYELVRYDYYNGNEVWDRATFVQGLDVRNDSQVEGVILLQRIEDIEGIKLKVEIFPGGTATDFTDTEDTLYYVR